MSKKPLPPGLPGLCFGGVVILPGENGPAEIEITQQQTQAPAKIKGAKDGPAAQPGTSVILTPLSCGKGNGVTTGPEILGEDRVPGSGEGAERIDDPLP